MSLSASSAHALSSSEASLALARFLSTRASASRHLHAAGGVTAGAPLADDAYDHLSKCLDELRHQAAEGAAAQRPDARAARAAGAAVP